MSSDPGSPPGDHVVLVGLSGTGKTTLATRLARQLGRSALDTDRMVERRAGATVAQVFARQGEATFRGMEADALAEALAGRPAVIATGGGIVVDDGNRRLLHERGTVVWLRCDLTTLARRLRHPAESRPLLDGDVESTLRRLASEREALYRDVADVVVDTSALDRSEVPGAVLAALSASGRRPTRAEGAG